MNSVSWQRSCADIAFLVFLLETDTWSKAGLAWHSFFFVPGDFYQQEETKQVFRAMGGHTFAQPFWPCKHIRDNMWAEDITANPVWLSMLSWTDFSALPAETLSPLGSFVRGLDFVTSPMHLLATTPVCPRRHSALAGFKGCQKDDLQKLAQELQINTRGLHPQVDC